MGDQSENYLLLNDRQDKRIAIAISIDGLEQVLTNRVILVPVTYGDPDIFYGDVGLLYGGLRVYEDGLDIMSLDGSSLSINQRLEPEQGKGSVSIMSLAFIDKDKFMTQLLTPGLLVPDLLGRAIKIELGYDLLAYPNDYSVIFRGFVSGFQYRSGLVTLQLSDPGSKKRQTVFYAAKSYLNGAITSGQTTITLVNGAEFHKHILGPNGSYDPAIKTYFKIEDEFIEYPNGQPVGNVFTGCTRGARSTVAASHANNTEAMSYIQIQDHAIDMALKIMLSGWNGPWKTDVPIYSLVKTFEPSLGDISNAIVFPFNVDVKREYGLTIGDYVTISGSGVPANNATRTIIDIIDKNDQNKNNIVLLSSALTAEYPTTATLSFRSKYDTYPISCGLKMTPNDVDVEGHETLKALFLADTENSYQFFLNSQQNGKQFIENEIYLPIAVYSLTRQGRLSANITKPPIAGEDLRVLDQDNILDPASIVVERGINNRKFFNQIVFDYDLDDSGEYLSTFRLLDSDSLNQIGFTSTLRISSQGAKSLFFINATNLLTRRANFLLSRYKRGAIQITLKVNYGVGNLIEVGDVIALDGEGLEIANWENGTRELGTQLFEVIERNLDIRTGIATVKLVNGLGASTTDRFAVISPSSLLDVGSTVSALKIKPSFSTALPKYPGNERKKWLNYAGLPIVVHSEDWSYSEETVLTGFDNADTTLLYIDPPLSAPPPADYIVDIPHYPTGTDPTENSLYKAAHAHLSPQLEIVSGINSKSFTVSVGDAAKLLVGAKIRIHNYSYTIDSLDKTVESVVGTTVTTFEDIGFTPAAGQKINVVGFPDGGGAYRVF